MSKKRKKRMFVFPDIHGEYEELEQLLNIIMCDTKISFNSQEDLIIFLGDYIDRGPDSSSVVERVIDLVDRKIAVALLGNHEKLMLDSYSTGDFLLWHINGGLQTQKSYEGKAAFLEKHMEFFKNLPLMYETEKYIFVHAGLMPGVPLSQQSIEDMLWVREKWLFGKSPVNKTVVFGHTPVQKIGFNSVISFDNKIAVDTGCGKGGFLSVLELPAGTIYTKNNKPKILQNINFAC